MSSPLSDLKEARELQLFEWIEEDATNGDFTYQGAIRKWLEDVSLRLPTRRPLRVKIPKIFVNRLHLEGQRVHLTTCQNVLVEQPNEALGRVGPRPLLVKTST